MDKKDFQSSEKGKNKSVLELANNLNKVLEQPQKDKESTLKPSNANVSLPTDSETEHFKEWFLASL